VSGLRSIAASGGFTIEASELGKFKMVVQIVSVVAVILDHRWKEWPVYGNFIFPVHWIAYAAIWFVVCVSLISAVDYFAAFWSKIDGKSPSAAAALSFLAAAAANRNRPRWPMSPPLHNSPPVAASSPVSAGSFLRKSAPCFCAWRTIPFPPRWTAAPSLSILPLLIWLNRAVPSLRSTCVASCAVVSAMFCLPLPSTARLRKPPVPPPSKTTASRPSPKDEAPHLEIELSILSPPQPILPESVEVGRHGLLISQHGRRGLLLPQVAIEHKWDRAIFLEQTCRKAHLPPDAWQKGATLQAFSAEIFSDKTL